MGRKAWMPASTRVYLTSELLRALRLELIERTKHRTDTAFTAVFGDRLEKLTDRRIMDLAAGALLERIQSAPSDKTGLPWFDARPVIDGRLFTADDGTRVILSADGTLHPFGNTADQAAQGEDNDQ